MRCSLFTTCQTSVFWIASFVLVILDWRSGRPVLGAGLRTTSGGIGSHPKDPPFRRPTHDDAESIISRDPSRYRRRRGDDDEEEDDEIQSPFADPRGAYAPTSGRASMDMYGAFSDPAPSGYAAGGPQRGGAPYYSGARSTTSPPPAAQYQSSPPPRQGAPPGVSRTMALAYEDTGTTSSSGYEDPYDRVQATLASPRTEPHNAPPTYQYRLS